MAQATIVTPISGTVVAVNMNVGDSVTAGSSTEDIIVQGAGGFEVSTTVDVSDISKVKVGETSTVLPDGARTAMAGKVVAVGIAADTSGDTPTYPVVVGFTGSTASLRNGQTGSVSIVIDRSASTLAVPTSAVTTTGTAHTVSVLVKGKPTTTPVEVGAVGAEYTAITSGLTQGQLVVLADLSAPLPGSATATATTTGRNGATGTGRFRRRRRRLRGWRLRRRRWSSAGAPAAGPAAEPDRAVRRTGRAAGCAGSCWCRSGAARRPPAPAPAPCTR